MSCTRYPRKLSSRVRLIIVGRPSCNTLKDVAITAADEERRYKTDFSCFGPDRD